MQAFVISRSVSFPGGKSGLMTSTVGCARSSASLPADATTVTPWLCAYRIARWAALKSARWPALLRQL